MKFKLSISAMSESNGNTNVFGSVYSSATNETLQLAFCATKHVQDNLHTALERVWFEMGSACNLFGIHEDEITFNGVTGELEKSTRAKMTLSRVPKSFNFNGSFSKELADFVAPLLIEHEPIMNGEGWITHRYCINLPDGGSRMLCNGDIILKNKYGKVSITRELGNYNAR